MIAIGGADETPPPPGVQVVFLHQPPDLLGVYNEAAVPEFGIDPAVAIPLELVSDVVDLGHDHRVRGLADGCDIETRSRDPHQFAPPLDSEAGGPTVADVGAFFCKGLDRGPALYSK